MRSFELHFEGKKAIKILCLGAHCDDIEIGCGGTLLGMLKRYKNAEVHWKVFSSDPGRAKEARSSSDIFLERAKSKTVTIEKFRNGYFPYTGGEIKACFEVLKEKFAPDVIFTHYRADLHQDHRTISELTWNTFRNHLILEYEIPKYDGDFGTPNLFVPLESSVCDRKIRSILASFRSQGGKHWLTEDLLSSTLRIRGMECVSPTNYAEAFYIRKSILEL
jgi:LmbE family N-acetylglucosaminyl deacetylase